MTSAFSTLPHVLSTEGGLEVRFTEYRPADDQGLTPLLCLPGYWRNQRDFAALAARLASTRRVITADMRGRGTSDRATDASAYHFDLLVGDVWEILDALGIDRFVGLGATLGGLMVLELARLQPARVVGAIFNDVGPEGVGAAVKRAVPFGTAEEFSRAEAIERTRKQNGRFYPGFRDADWERMMLMAHRETTEGKFTRDFDQLTGVETARFKAHRPTFWAEFEALAACHPVTVLRGALSDYLPEPVAERMAEAAPGVRVVTVPDCGHPPQLDEPAAIGAIEQLLAKVDATPSAVCRASSGE